MVRIRNILGLTLTTSMLGICQVNADLAQAKAGFDGLTTLNKTAERYEVSNHVENRFSDLKGPFPWFGTLSVGAWQPLQSLSQIGMHPFMGLGGGLGQKLFSIEAICEWRFLKSPHDYQVQVADSVFSTDQFSGYTFGLGIRLGAVSLRDSRLNLILGGGFEVFEALAGDDPGNDYKDRLLTKYIDTGCLNFGIGYKQRLSFTYFLNIEVRYNLLDYTNRGGTDLSGKALSLRTTLEMVSSAYQARMIE